MKSAKGPYSTHQTKLLVLLGIIGFASLALLMLMSGNASSQAYKDKELLATQNTVAEVSSIAIQSSYLRKRIIYGQVESAMQSDVGFELAGVLRTILVEEGANVRKGQALAELDLARLDAQRNELEAALRRAQADAKLAELSAQRVSDLVNAKLEPQQRLDESQASLDAAQALVTEVEARLQSLEVEKQKSVLKAPFDGQIIAQLADEGTVLNVGQPLLSVISIDTLEARFGLPENTAFALAPGDAYNLQVSGTTLLANVKSVAKRRTLATRTVDTLFSIDKTSISPRQLAALVSGDLVSISVEEEVSQTGAWVPVDALANGVRGLWTVMIYDQATKTIVSRSVSVEHLDGERAFISGAIEDAQKIIVNGTHRFTPGQKVNQVNAVKTVATSISTANKSE
jgi:RND family efflux transporter MFP subunit